MEESSPASQSIPPLFQQMSSTGVSKKVQSKEYQEAKKAFEARLWAVVKCTKSYSAGASGSSSSKSWFFPYCKTQKSGSVARF